MAPRSPQLAALGAALRDARDARGLSQVDVARTLAVKQSYVSELETGARNPSFSTLLRLCDALDVELTELAALYEAHLRPT